MVNGLKINCLNDSFIGGERERAKVTMFKKIGDKTFIFQKHKCFLSELPDDAQIKVFLFFAFL